MLSMLMINFVEISNNICCGFSLDSPQRDGSDEDNSKFALLQIKRGNG